LKDTPIAVGYDVHVVRVLELGGLVLPCSVPGGALKRSSPEFKKKQQFSSKVSAVISIVGYLKAGSVLK
jgi:hypothetical protein